MIKQTTIAEEITFSGIGLHTGLESTVVIMPSEANTGIVFYKKVDGGEVAIKADVNNIVNTQRCTSIGRESESISTVEHLLSAIFGLGIHNLRIEILGSEIPILDGSAERFVALLSKAGRVQLDDTREVLIIEESFVYIDEETGSKYEVLPCDELQITTLIDFDDQVLGQQYASLEHVDSYAEQIASSKTFVYLEELELLHNQGLIKGGNLDNAVIIAKKGVTPEQVEGIKSKLGLRKVENTDSLTFDIGNFKYANEAARHKLLDLMGDIALLGVDIHAKIIATRPGHKSNASFTKELKRMLVAQRKLRGKPLYDPSQPPIYNTEQVASLLPHRYPFLLVDKIIMLNETTVVGVKNVTMNEQLFQGHFPGNPVFPGVLQMEALAQTGGILALYEVDDPKEWVTYFLKMDNVKFKNMVVPGDTLILKMELLSPIRRGICHMQGTAYVGNKIVSEGELTAQILKKTQ